MHAYEYACMHLCMHMHMHMHMHCIHASMHAYAHAYAYAFAYMHLCMHMHMHMHAFVCICMHAYVYAYPYASIHSSIHPSIYPSIHGDVTTSLSVTWWRLNDQFVQFSTTRKMNRPTCHDIAPRICSLPQQKQYETAHSRMPRLARPFPARTVPLLTQASNHAVRGTRSQGKDAAPTDAMAPAKR